MSRVRAQGPGLYDTLNQEEARDGEIVRLTDTLPGFVLFCYS